VSSSSVRDTAVVFGSLAVALGLLVAGAFGHRLPPALRVVMWPALSLVGAFVVAGPDALDLLGLRRVSGRGVAVALLGSLGMAAGLAWGATAPPTFDLVAVWDGALRPALSEELLFRGLAFSVLFWRAGWSFPAAMLTTGLLFGVFHLPSAIAGGHLDQAWGTAAITAAGGCWYAWLYARWDRSLWVPIATHFAMNAWWVIYTAGPTAAGGGPGATWGRVATIVIITVATGKMTSDELR